MNRELARLELDRQRLLAKLVREGTRPETPLSTIATARVQTGGNLRPDGAEHSRRRQQLTDARDRRRRS